MTYSNGGRGEYCVFTGNSNRPLAEAICGALGRPLSKADVGRFSDGEIQVEIHENVRGHDAFVVQSTCSDANINLMELLITIDALKRASAGSINAVIPYYGYARQDRKVASRSPISAKLVADLLVAAGATRVVSMDMHAGQIQGFFNIPFDHLYAAPVLLGDMKERRAYSKRLGTTLGIVDKRRLKANVAEVMNVIGDVHGKTAILLDDMIDTAGTLTQAANALMDKGAKRVFAYATHAVLSGPAVDRIQKSPLEEVVVSDTIPLSAEAAGCRKIRSLTVANLLAEAIRRIHQADSLSSLFV
jgi:ribose-phosphate pyrophosphokinase